MKLASLAVFHDRTLLKHVGRYIVVENHGGQFQENCVWTSRVIRPLSKVGKSEIVLKNEL